MAMLAGQAMLSGHAMADDQASLRLNWIIYGFHTPFYLGLQRGYYKQQGIDLTIGEGKGSASTVQVVASGGDTFGLSDSSSIITGAVRGAAVRAVMQPDMDHDLSMAQLKVGFSLIASPHGPDQPVGWMSAQDWDETLALMKQYQDLKTDEPASAFWTAEFLPK
jgi:hypothetical protein